MRPFFLAVLILVFVPGTAAAQRPWHQVPGLRALVEGQPVELVLPIEKGGDQVTVALGRNPPAQLPFEEFDIEPWQMARLDFREEGYRNTFRVYSLLGPATPVRAILVNGDWVDDLPLQLGPQGGLAVAFDRASLLGHYDIRSTQHEGLWCLTGDAGERWLMRLAPELTGERFAVWTFFDTRLEIVLGDSDEARSQVFKSRTLNDLFLYLLPNYTEKVLDLTALEQMYAMGEHVNAAQPTKWRQDFITVLQQQSRSIAENWAKLRPLKVSALQALTAKLASAPLDRPLPIGDFAAAWNGTYPPAASASRESTAPPSVAAQAMPASSPEIPSASHPLEVEFWAAFKGNKAVAGLTAEHVRPYARLLAAGPQKSSLLSYLSLALLAAERPSESPYLGREGEERLKQWVATLRAMEKGSPSREEVVAALGALDSFFLTHTAPLNLERAAMEVLISPLAAMHAAQHLRAAGPKAGIHVRWANPVARTLERQANGAFTRGQHALAAGLFLYGHWLNTPEISALIPTRYTDNSWEGKMSLLQAARSSAALSAWHYFWPALDPRASETRAIVEILNRDPVLARTPFTSVLGMTPGDATTFGEKYRVHAGLPKMEFHVVAGNPPKWMGANQPQATQPAVWPLPEPPALRQARKKLTEARLNLKKEIDSYQSSRRFWGLDSARADLAEFDGTSAPIGRSPEVDSARQGLDAARAAYDKDLRDGVYIGRSLDRADTLYTRDLTSMERRSREFELEVMARQLADQQREAQRQQDEQAARARQRDRLTDEIFEIEKKIDTPGHLAKAAELRTSLAYYEKRYAEVLKQQGQQGVESGLNAEKIARAHFVRAHLKDGVMARYNDLAKQAKASNTIEDHLEAAWYGWLFDFPETREATDVVTFYGTAEAEEMGREQSEDASKLGKPLAEFAEVLLEPLAPAGPTRFVSGLPLNLQPRFQPSSAWCANQVEGLLNDTWFRHSHDSYAMRGQVFQVVKALRAATGDDAAALDSLRPWMRRFRALAPAETQRVVLSWEKEPQLTQLMTRAKE